MGYQNEHAQVTGRPWLAFDIETCPMPDCAQYVTDPIEAPANYKDPAKIAAYIEEKRAGQLAKAALDLDLCEIVAVGWTIASPLPLESAYAQTREFTPEPELIDGFWRFVRAVQSDAGVLVGFNCLTFDLPILLRRSLYLGIPAPSLQVDKYRHDGVIDVADVLTYGGRMPWRSLAFYAKRFGIPHDDRVTGEQIPQLAAEGQWDTIAAHVRGDVQTTTALAQRIGLIHQPAPEPVAQAVA